MRKIYTLLLTALTAGALHAQVAAPNGGFENWNNLTYDDPQYYNSSNTQAHFLSHQPFNCIKTTDAYHGSYAVKLTTEISNGDSTFGYFINGNPNGPPTNYWPGGVPYTQQPTGIRGYYKSNVMGNDTARILAVFKKNGANIGIYLFPVTGVHNTYTLFNFPLLPALPMAPDTVIFGAASSDFINSSVNANGSMLQLDSISFTGAASQPAMFNGDFELWQSHTIYQPVSWNQVSDGSGTGVLQSTDAHSGSYAAEMLTYAGMQNNTPIARAGNISTGFWVNNNPNPLGGFPFTHQSDTLNFYFKYAPSNASAGLDSGIVLLTLKKNGVPIYMTGLELGLANAYTLIQIPFNAGQVPDTAIVTFASSIMNDTAMIYVGSDLKVDDIYFSSSPLGIPGSYFSNAVSVFPNPSNGVFTLNGAPASSQVIIYNALGAMIYSSQINNPKFEVDLTTQPQGIYFYRVFSGDKLISSGKMEKE